MAAIARSAGSAHGLLFHHFGSKRGLYLAVLEETTRRRRRRFADIDEAAVGSLDDGGRIDVSQLAEALLRLLHTSLSNLALLDPAADITTALAVARQWQPLAGETDRPWTPSASG